MFAITATGFRAITSEDQLLPGETAVEQVPDVLVRMLKARAKRNTLLRSTDWTQITDSALPTLVRTQWATYRQALRDLPSAPGFPDTVTWPQEPGLPDGAASVPIR